MDSKVKALIWEECCVGGAIAAACLAVGMLLLLDFKFVVGATSWTNDASFIGFVVIGMPMFAALLLILNPDYSGHLVGGFSARVLRLPVRTSVAVAVALGARTTFVFLTTLVLTSLSSAFFEDAPGIEVVYSITILYLIAQVLDWLRAPVSGLSSLMVLSLCTLGVLRLIYDTVDIEGAISTVSQPQSLYSLMLVAVVAYAVSAAAVHAGRAGRRIGVPEIWEWPNRISFKTSTRLKPFGSPMTAQIWFELRSSRWILPIGWLLLSVLFIGAVLLSTGYGIDWRGTREDTSVYGHLSSYLVYLALVLAAVAQGMSTEILSFRNPSKKSSYEYLQPLTGAQFARARSIAGCVLLFPTLALAVGLHFLMAGGTNFLELIARAHELGFASNREIIWIVCSRGFLAGLLAWFFLVGGTRMFARVMILSSCAMLTTYALSSNESLERYSSLAVTAFMLFLFASTLWLFSYARRQGLMPTRDVIASVGIWFLIAWLFRYAVTAGWLEGEMTLRDHLEGLLTAVSCSALVPLAYIGIVLEIRRRRHTAAASSSLVPLAHIGMALDIRRRRHGAARPQDVSQHGRGAQGRWPYTKVAVALVVLAVLWLGWPTKPAYEEFWGGKGYPLSLAELNEWYTEPAPEENVALELDRVAQNRARLIAAHSSQIPVKYLVTGERIDFRTNLLVIGHAEFQRGEPIARELWDATEAYWSDVTSRVAPQLREAASRDASRSRYPVDLREGYSFYDEHLAKLRALVRELRLDALHWAVASEQKYASDNVLAIFSIANSLSNEPVLISQQVRLRLVSTGAASIETLLDRSVPAEEVLARLQQACADRLPDSAGGMALDRGLVGEITMLLHRGNNYGLPDSLATRAKATPASLAVLLLYPVAGERMMVVLRTEELLHRGNRSWSELSQLMEDQKYFSSGFVSLFVDILFPASSRIYEAEWRTRMQLETARTALAVERYRLEQGRLPEDLNELVPAYLSEVPEDYFAGGGTPLRYRSGDDSEYVVYSVGRDTNDNGGVERENWNSEGDIIFTVAPLATRIGNHIE